MTTQKTALWISRELAEEVYECAITADGAVTVYVIQAPAGLGKTFLARDIGTRLGSTTGYEASRKDRIAWSGILDLYDADTNSNEGLERRLITAFETSGSEFNDYRIEREQYNLAFMNGVVGSNLEKHRRKVDEAFVRGMQAVCEHIRPILVFDTVERLEGASDPTQVELQNEIEFSGDTASVMGWLISQITQLNNGVFLLLGRRAPQFYKILGDVIQQENEKRTDKIIYKNIPLGHLNEAELQDFFANRVERHPDLKKLLTADLQTLLVQQIGGNPLLLDLSLETLRETGRPASIQQVLDGKDGLQSLEGAIVAAYMNTFSDSDRHVLLYYLALARSGLFADLLEALEPQRAPKLMAELTQMEDLPFIKVRDISVTVPGIREPYERHTYFLHDAMYVICDRVLSRPEQVTRDNKRLVEWYDQQLSEHQASFDLIVESLFYRMRADPQEGYNWYLRQADQAIRSVRTDLDMRLHNEMSLFMISAKPETEYEPGQSLNSPIDYANVQKFMPRLFDQFRLDSATLWIKRYTMRGKRDLAEQIGKKSCQWAENIRKENPMQYTLPFAEFLLWYGQAIMYGYNIEEALPIYNRTLNILESPYSNIHVENLNKFDLWRYNLILGRTHNNLGYTYWMYLGQYSHAVQEFQKAIRLFRIAELDEELANSSDNLGRVYALLGSEFQAFQLIRNGLTTRVRSGLAYREALSENSLGNTLSRFGNIALALKEVESALVKFHRAGIERGVGLGLLTKGVAYRNWAETWPSIPLEDAIRYTNLAEMDLRDAVRIFTTAVKEPIREVEAYNELACCYRARYLILEKTQAPAREQDMAFSQGKLNFLRAIDVAHEHHYVIDELDSVQDLAVLMVRAQQYQEAKLRLEYIRNNIPVPHQIRSGKGLEELEVEEKVDAYYKLMGQIELLEGAMEFKKGVVNGEVADEAAILKATRHYLLAVSYFSRYSGESFAKRQTYTRIYRRFQDCPPELIRKIADEYLPQRIKEYCLSDELVRGLFQDILALL